MTNKPPIVSPERALAFIEPEVNRSIDAFCERCNSILEPVLKRSQNADVAKKNIMDVVTRMFISLRLIDNEAREK